MSRQQANTTVEVGADVRGYEVGRRLRFVGHAPGEAHIPSIFRCGDVLRSVERNGCGMGIDCRRELDGATDMVWPEEVVTADCRTGGAS